MISAWEEHKNIKVAILCFCQLYPNIALIIDIWGKKRSLVYIRLTIRKLPPSRSSNKTTIKEPNIMSKRCISTSSLLAVVALALVSWQAEAFTASRRVFQQALGPIGVENKFDRLTNNFLLARQEKSHSEAHSEAPETMVSSSVPQKLVSGNKASVDLSNIPVKYVAETKLPTDIGRFKLRAYKMTQETKNSMEPCVIYSQDKPPFGTDRHFKEGVPLRVHDQCLTSEVFRSQRYVRSSRCCVQD